MGELDERRDQTASRLEKLRNRLTAAAEVASGKACVYATGSFGRCEASSHSDLDVFILGRSKPGSEESQLNGLDEICIKADLIEATRTLGIPEFSGDGRWFQHHSVKHFTSKLGTPEDDSENTFTARLLLLLESRPVIEMAVYRSVIQEVVAAYWRDYTDHKADFIPAFLSNDILRLWRTFCVNYEARTDRVPDEKKARGKLKNYKLKHSRLLTCYSALLCLLAVYRRANTVSPTDALAVIYMTPTERLEWLLLQSDLSASHNEVRKLLDQYERFLATSNRSETELVNQFLNKELSRRYFMEALEFGDTLFHVLTKIGDGSRFHRLLVV